MHGHDGQNTTFRTHEFST